MMGRHITQQDGNWIYPSTSIITQSQVDLLAIDEYLSKRRETIISLAVEQIYLNYVLFQQHY